MAAASRKLATLVFAGVAIGLSAPDVLAQPAAVNPARGYVQPPLTKDRLTDEALRALVAHPLAEMLAGDVPAGERDLEALVKERTGPDRSARVAVADTLSAIGILLFVGAFDPPNEDLQKESLTYLRRAISATRAAFGDNDPEVALALNTYATAMSNLNPMDPGTETEVDLQEAYEIRLAALGPYNSETVDVLGDLAMVKGLPARTGGDAGKIAEVSGLFAKAIDGAQYNPAYTPSQRGDLYLKVAEFWARNSNAALASDNFAKFEQQYHLITDGGDGGDQIADTLASGAIRFASALENSGHKTETEALRKRYATQIADMVSRAKHIP